MYLAPATDPRDGTRAFAARDIAGHDIVHAAEPRLGQSCSAHGLFPPFCLIGMVLLVIDNTGIAPFVEQMLPSSVPIMDTMTFLILILPWLLFDNAEPKICSRRE